MQVNKRMTLAVLPVAATLMLSGCAATQAKQSAKATQTTQQVQQTAQEIRAEAANATAKDTTSQTVSSAQTAAVAGSESLLPPAKPGECYARILIPAKYETKTEKMLKKAESERIEIIPAQYGWEEKTIQTADSSYNLVPISGNFDTKTTKYQISKGRRYWAISLKPGAAEANTALLEAAKNGGINLDSTQAGTCYHEHYIPPKYKTVTEQVIATESSEKIQVIPAKYEWAEEQILVREPSFKLINVPETYKKVTEKILVEPAKTVWKKGQGPVEKLDNSTGEIVCLVEVPAKYKTITKTVVANPATTKKVEIPAVYKTVKVKKLIAEAQEKHTAIPATYKTISKKVLESDGRLVWHEIHDKSLSRQSRTGHQICLRETKPTFASYTTKVVRNTPTTKKVALPAKHKTIKIRKLIAPAQTKRIKIPAQYQTVNKRVKINDEHMEWVPILCETNFNIGLISQLQKKLEAIGFNPGPIDGAYGRQTYKAVTEFQKKKGLSTGHLTMETLRALGVAYQ
jgi:uncharacterized lipoprotein YehR (DUF1307 family)